MNTRMPGRPYVLAETNWQAAEREQYQVGVLPWGATEPHNYHLPFGTDGVEAEETAIESSRLAWEAGCRPLVLPTIPFGVNTQQFGLGPTINMSPSTQSQVLQDVVTSLEEANIPKLVVLNGHGGNDFRQMIRELQAESPVFLCTLNWYTVLPADEYFAEPGDHAGELETSMMMHLRPEQVLPLDQAGAGDAKRFRVTGLREGWAWAPRDWAQVTEDTGVGNPQQATAEKGAAFFSAMTRRISEFLIQLAEADLDNFYR